MSFVDLHLHLLPGLDDGPASLQESLVHANRLVADGVCEVVATPHVAHPDFRVCVADIAAQAAALQESLDQLGVGLRVHAGGEIHAEGVDELAADELELLAQGPRGARWVLLEAPFDGLGLRFVRSCDRLWSLGFRVLVAHPERSADILGNGLKYLRLLLSGGAQMQVSVCSLLGRHGETARTAAERLIRNGSAYVVASDGHGGRRCHTLRHGHDLLRRDELCSPLRAAQLTRANPRLLLTHGLVDAPEAEAAVTFP